MKKALFVFVTAVLGLAVAPAKAGVKVQFGKNAKSIHIPVAAGRSFWAEPAFEDYAFMLEDACSAMGLTGKACLIYPLNAEIGENAIATVVDGNRVIIYGRDLSPKVGYVGALGVMSHELGHHYCGHIGAVGDPHDMELAADQFAGAVLRRMKFSLVNATSMAEAFDARPSPSHPGKELRSEALRAGWENPDLGKSCQFKRRQS